MDTTNIRKEGDDFIAYVGEVEVGRASTYAAALGKLSEAVVARITHQTPTTPLTIETLKEIRAEGRLAEYIAGLDNEALAAVAHVMVAANHASGRAFSFEEVHRRLYLLREAANEPASAETLAVSIVSSYDRTVNKIVVRAAGGLVLAECDTWLQVGEYLQSLGVR